MQSRHLIRFVVGQPSSLERGRDSALCTLLYHPLMLDPSQYVLAGNGRFPKSSFDRSVGLFGWY